MAHIFTVVFSVVFSIPVIGGTKSERLFWVWVLQNSRTKVRGTERLRLMAREGLKWGILNVYLLEWKIIISGIWSLGRKKKQRLRGTGPVFIPHYCTVFLNNVWLSTLQCKAAWLSFPNEHQESIPSINLQSIDQISQVIFNKYAVLVMHLKELLQLTFNLTCQRWNIIIVLTHFSNNFVQKINKRLNMHETC